MGISRSREGNERSVHAGAGEVKRELRGEERAWSDLSRRIRSLEMARNFISNPEAAKAAAASGVLDGEYHFVEDAGGYR
jgi:hypothetical protein